MLSVKPIKSASHAGHYFERDNYYAKDSPEAREASSWYGRGASVLGLTGPIEPERFKALLEGNLPNGEQLGRRVDGQRQHRPGYDAVFSAPKSVSVLAEIGGDKRLILAHQEAVHTALDKIEKECAQARQSIGGAIEYQHTQNLVVATFSHDVSRALDPQLHTHCVILNMTERADGKWRALASQSPQSMTHGFPQGFLEQVHYRQRYLGAIYRAVLAEKVARLGYRVERTHRDGRFEIKEVPEEVKRHFSQRREDMEKVMAETGVTSARAASLVAVMTRPNKVDVDRDALKASWEERCAALSFDPKAIVEHAQKMPEKTVPRDEVAPRAIQKAIAHLSEREASFTDDQLKQTTFSYGLGNVTPRDVDAAIQALKKEGQLLEKKTSSSYQTVWTTPQAQSLEKQTLHWMREGQQQVTPMADPIGVQLSLATQSLTDGQFKAATLITTSTDRVIGIQGYAGTGKTTMLEQVKLIADVKGIDVQGIAPTAAAAKQLTHAARIPSQTLQQFLIQQGGQHTSLAKTLVVLDEASMVPTRLMRDVLRLMHEREGRLVLMGDRQQLGAIEAGKPFYQLQQAGMATVVMDQIVRQKNSMLLDAVHHAIDGHVQQALGKIGENVHVIENKTERLTQIAVDYLRLSADERAATVMITPANADRKQLNAYIREGLKKEGSLQTVEMTCQTLEARHFTRTETQDASYYKEGDVIRFNASYQTLGIEKGTYVTVESKDVATNSVVLVKENGQRIYWEPHCVAGKREGALEVYEKAMRTLAVGEKIRWTRNDKANGLINSERATVQAMDVSRKQVVVRLDDGTDRTIALTKEQYQHWDHAYVNTVYAAQGKTAERVLAHDESFRPQLTNQASFYVAISRAKQEAHLYVDNKERYTQTLLKNTGEKESALEDVALKKGATNEKEVRLEKEEKLDANREVHGVLNGKNNMEKKTEKESYGRGDYGQNNISTHTQRIKEEHEMERD